MSTTGTTTNKSSIYWSLQSQTQYDWKNRFDPFQDAAAAAKEETKLVEGELITTLGKASETHYRRKNSLFDHLDVCDLELNSQQLEQGLQDAMAAIPMTKKQE